MSRNFLNSSFFKTIKLRYFFGAMILVCISLMLSLSYVFTLDKIQRKSFALLEYLENKYNLKIQYDSYHYGLGSITFSNLTVDGAVQANLEKAEVRIKLNQLFSDKNSLSALDLILIESGQILLKDSILDNLYLMKKNSDLDMEIEKDSTQSLSKQLLSVLEINDVDFHWKHSEHPLVISKVSTQKSLQTSKKFFAQDIKWQQHTLFENLTISLNQPAYSSAAADKSNIELSIQNRIHNLNVDGSKLDLTAKIFKKEKKIALNIILDNLPNPLREYFKEVIPKQLNIPYQIQLHSTIQSTRDGLGGLFEIKTNKLPLLDSRVSQNTFQLDSRIKFRTLWNPNKNQLVLENGFIELGLEKQKIWFSGSYTKDESDAIKLSLRIPPSSCETFKNSIPQELLSHVYPFDLSGKLSAKIDLSLNPKYPEKFTIENLDSSFACIPKSTPYLYSVERLEGDFQYENKYRKNQTKLTMGSAVSTPNFTPLTHISNYLIQSVVSLEDKNFFHHHGFEWSSIESAIRNNLKAKQFKVGASTITMQLAKNLFLDRTKNISRKIQEAFLTWHLENILSKERILEIYLNYVEFSPGVFGVNEGSHYYFSKHPSSLTQEESVFLAKALPSPQEHVKEICGSKENSKITHELKQSFQNIFKKNPDPKKIQGTLASAKKQCQRSIALDFRESQNVNKFR